MIYRPVMSLRNVALLCSSEWLDHDDHELHDSAQYSATKFRGSIEYPNRSNRLVTH